jgi:hypothetical protein
LIPRMTIGKPYAEENATVTQAEEVRITPTDRLMAS